MGNKKSIAAGSSGGAKNTEQSFAVSKGNAVTKPPLSSSRQPLASSSHHSKTIRQSAYDPFQHETSNSSLTKVPLATSNEGRKKE
jgi:hypothetical protein